MFQSFAIAVADGNCGLYNVSASASKGIGCISLRGTQQAGWLVGTVVVLAASLCLELADLLVLVLFESAAKWREVKTYAPAVVHHVGFTDVVILIVYMVYGILNAGRLPSEVTQLVWVFRKKQSLGIATVCRGTLISPGVRGSVMGWMDGFLSSWGHVYFGGSY